MTRVLWLVVLVSAVQCKPMTQDELEDFSNFLLMTSSLDLHVKKGADPDDALDEEEVASDHAWEESGKFEGDLILNDRQRRLIVENVEGLSRNGLTDSTKKWPNNEVVYFIQREHFTSGQVQAIQDGIDDLARASCVKFRPYRKGDRDAVVIQGSRRGCFSQVGYQGGYQVLNLSGRHPVGRGCFRHGTVVHELLHSLGFYHMQSSPDRDDYIDVIWANIVQPARHNFRKYNSFSVSDYGVGYDYDSVLHYSRRAFSVNGQDTLVPKKNGAEIGQRVGLSDKDTLKLNKMYCDADNDNLQADENATPKPKNKKKKPKNQPFEGHGIGYHQGKTVVIQLPAAETYKISNVNVPSTHVFDFSKTPQILSTPKAGGYRFGEEVIYQHTPSISQNIDTITEHKNIYDNPSLSKTTFHHHQQPNDEKEESAKEDKKSVSSLPNVSNEIKPDHAPIDEHDKDLKEAFHRLTQIVKQHVYPQNYDNDYKINKDYSIFLTRSEPKKSNTFKGSLDDDFNQPITYDSPPPYLLKQIEKTNEDKLVLTDNLNKNYTPRQFEDTMDKLYGVSLPTKKPYSSNEQTETPHYATLEYLQGRQDFSNLYLPETPEDNKQRDEQSEAPDSDKKKLHDSIKINPHEQGFYSDYVQKSVKNNPIDASSEDIRTEKETLNEYKQSNIPVNEQHDSRDKPYNDRIDSSYRLLLPTKKPYSSDEHTDTPIYATLEYLKDRHDISHLYKPKHNEYEKEPFTVGDLPTTQDDWYNKDIYKQNPASYDRDSYADNIETDRTKLQEDKAKGQILDASHYDKGDDDEYENGRKSLKKVKPKIVNKAPDFFTNHKMKGDKIGVTDGSKHNNSDKKNEETNHRVRGYEYDYRPDLNEGDTYTLTDAQKYDYIDDETSKESPKPNKSKSEALKSYQEYHPDYEKDDDDGLSSASNENVKENSEELSNKTQRYSMFSAPVPLTKDWFKASYSIPEAYEHKDNVGLNKYDYR